MIVLSDISNNKDSGLIHWNFDDTLIILDI